MPNPRVPPVAFTHPGDIVQVTDGGHPAYTRALIVESTHRWGCWALEGLQEGAPKHRLRTGTFQSCGVAVLANPEIAKARSLSIETERLLKEGR